ncbi:sulfite exporter TauE/SafE family protein [Picrophilus oshimae]|uniref:Probable membrane transporter protein n=1 Tax=Picrophilus torridus (strain ATCC 700027 / DSM 9790 / JCM 10055 / NBRC 100828 / KAW 2/3) TaxID=1122961 RepID=Q6KZP4_PICTO|nr:sulfite exporter TauE/SafE family protein [Picrophilus oshimae]AAT43808.1 hypothetical protein PTO1223 [Picrophilus oshimae DSM 9789]SMD31124.1 hypothetical protein SAMN02745355_1044 [Picrophilus oshimae DSM 9789]
MEITIIMYILSIISGILVGFSLGLIGGGGSILAVPLLIYFVGLGVENTHLAIGTTALAVGINAFINFYQHLRKKNANLKIGGFFALIGVIGVIIGSLLGLIIKGSSLLFLFSFLMMGIGIYMYISKCRSLPSKDCKELVKETKYSKVSLFSIIVGFASGFFGIGGGFLIVPGLLTSTKIKISAAIGTSLLAVGTFGVVTAANYAIHGEVLFGIAAAYIIGGIGGGYFGTKISTSIPKVTLRKIFSIIIIIVGIYVAVTSYRGF